MNKIFVKLMNKLCVLFLNDIFIYFRTKKKHWRYVRTMLKRLRKFNFFVNFIERSMNDYHSLLWNLVILVRYMQVRAQEVCECQGASLNWPVHTTGPWLQHLRRLYFSTLPHSNRLCLLPSILTCPAWSFRASSHIATSLRAPPAM